jgi:hypothetical protein
MPPEDEVKTKDTLEEKGEASSLTTEESEEVDYKVLSEELEAKNRQLQNDFKSREGNRNRTQDSEDRLSRLEASNEASARGISQILGKMTGEDDEFAAEVQKGNQEAADKTRSAGAGAVRTEVMNGILDIVQVESEGEGDPTVLISKESQDQLSKLWGAATKEAEETGSSAPLYRVHMEASRMVLMEEQDKSRKALAAERAKAKSDTKKALEKAGVADQDTGPARSGAGGSERKRGNALIEQAIEEGSPLFPGAKSASV